MKIISFYKLLLILITQTIYFSEQIKHIIVACKGKNVDLLWKVDEEKNKISELEWYFKNKAICTSSPVEAFTVKPPYQGRIERIGKTEIRLKNLSQDDEGIYILFPLFEWSIADNMLEIELRILEPPTNYCTCNFGYPPDFKIELVESYCGRPQVSLVWKRKQTYEVLGEGNHILNSTLQDKEVLCCQDGEAMKCVDDNRQTQFCTTVSIPHRDNERSSEDGNTQCIDSVTMPGTDTGSTNIHHNQHSVLVIMTVFLLTALFILVYLIIFCIMIKEHKDLGIMRKKCKDLEETLSMLEVKPSKAVIKDEESVPILAENCEKHERVIKDGKQESVSVLEVKPSESVVMCEESVPILAENCEKHERVIKDGKRPRHVITSEDYEHQQSLLLEKMKEMLELQQAVFCKICHDNEMGMVFMPCSHCVTCACSRIHLKQCPDCRYK